MAAGLRAFVRFWIDFIVGDDPIIAVAVGVGLAATWALSAAHVSAWWLLPVVVVVALLVSLRRALTRPG